jgi:hypothetical protein
MVDERRVRAEQTENILRNDASGLYEFWRAEDFRQALDEHLRGDQPIQFDECDPRVGSAEEWTEVPHREPAGLARRSEQMTKSVIHIGITLRAERREDGRRVKSLVSEDKRLT